MAKIKVVSVGCEIPGGVAEFLFFDSDASLLDWDIIIFCPNISVFTTHVQPDMYQGKLSLSDTQSFRLRERMEHWRREIKDALQSGKTIIIYLPVLQEVFIDSGKRDYSGTGKNRQTTRYVDLYDNYRFLPFKLNPINSHGSTMQLVKGETLLLNYWAEFSRYSTYKVRIEQTLSKSLIQTKNGNKTVGAHVKLKDSPGDMLLLPYIDFDSELFFEESEDEEDEYVWTKLGLEFGHKFIDVIIQIDRNLKHSSSFTPRPVWANETIYDLPKEKKLNEKLLVLEGKIEKLQIKKSEIKEELEKESLFRKLLYENGVGLENAIIETLKLIGFNAANYNDSESEFDVVFESKEGRFLGEAEGKDNKAIGIDKLRQLEMNIHEDLSRDDVQEPAKGVLFGNAFRLTPLSERGVFFH